MAEGEFITLVVDGDSGKIKAERTDEDDFEIVVPVEIVLKPEDLVGNIYIHELFPEKGR